MGMKPGDSLMEKLDERAEATVGEFRIPALTQLVWALTKLDRKPHNRFMALLETRILSMKSEMESRHVVLLLWGYAAAGIQPQESMRSMLQCKVLETISELTCAQVAVIWWAAAQAKNCTALDDTTLQYLARRTNDLASSFNNQEQQMLRWSEALLRVTHGAATKKVLEVDILSTIRRMAPSSEMDSEAILALSEPPPKLPGLAAAEVDAVYDFCEDIQAVYECYTQVGPYSTEKAWLTGDTHSDLIQSHTCTTHLDDTTDSHLYTMSLTEVFVHAGHVVQRCGKSVRMLLHCGMVVRESVKDLGYTFRPLASGERKCERPGCEEPEPRVALSQGVTMRDQRHIDHAIARIDAAHKRKKTQVKEENEGGKGRTTAVEAHNPDIKGKTPQPTVEMLGKTEAAADISSCGSMKCALPTSAAPQEPVAGSYWNWNGPRRQQQFPRKKS
jgi:hypothetical protein